MSNLCLVPRPSLSPCAARAVIAGLFLVAAVTAQNRPYRAIDLGPVPGASPLAGVTSAAMSDDGEVLGGTSVWDPYVFRSTSGMLALQVATGFLNGAVYDVNDAGEAVGSCGLPTLSYPTTAAFWNANGSVQLLGNLGGYFSTAVAMNDNGVVVGVSDRAGSNLQHAFRWTAQTGMVDLTPGVPQVSTAADINDAGQILLQIDSASYRSIPGGGLDNLGGVAGWRINEYGQVAGKDVQTGAAGLYTDGSGWNMFGAGSPINFTQIGALNDFGQIGGSRWILQHPSPPSYQKIGYLWTEGLGFQRVADWVEQTPLPVTVTGVSGIDDRGRIFAHGSIGSDNRAMLLEPRFVAAHGPGCAPASSRVPKLAATGMPAGGGTLALLGAGGHDNGVGIFIVSPAPASTPLPNGCPLLVDANGALPVAAVNNSIGQARALLQLPLNVPQVTLYTQWVSLDVTQGLGSLSLSNALTIDLQ